MSYLVDLLLRWRKPKKNDTSSSKGQHVDSSAKTQLRKTLKECCILMATCHWSFWNFTRPWVATLSNYWPLEKNGGQTLLSASPSFSASQCLSVWVGVLCFSGTYLYVRASNYIKHFIKLMKWNISTGLHQCLIYSQNNCMYQVARSRTQKKDECNMCLVNMLCWDEHNKFWQCVFQIHL